MTILPIDQNHSLITKFFEIAEMQEHVALYKGLYLLLNAADFTINVEEGIRTNMVNVFDAIIAGNPFPLTYLEEWAWNQLVLKGFFLDRPLYTYHQIDLGKNENLANILQDYVRERWAADRDISPEIWRLISGYLRTDLQELIAKREFKDIEAEAITEVLKNNMAPNPKFWDQIGIKKQSKS